jgi:Ca2+-binding EF-hand superfamily protein
MPFTGNKDEKIDQIRKADYVMHAQDWKSLSSQANNFTEGLLQKDPDKRMTAQSAIAHEWIKQYETIDARIFREPQYVGSALTSWKSAPKLRRACLTLMAWNLPATEHAKYSDCFLALDSDHNGFISYGELNKFMVNKCQVEKSQFDQIFESLGSNQDEEIHYSDFVAAMICEHMGEINSSLLQTTFRQFDRFQSGFITPEDFNDVVGDEYDGTNSSSLILGADITKDGRIDYDEFASYVTSSGKMPSWRNPENRESMSSANEGSSNETKNDRVKMPSSRVDPRMDAPSQGCCTLM